MTTFTIFRNRKDHALTSFSADDNDALLQAICTNYTTGYVCQMRSNGPVSVPNHASVCIERHLVNLGWEKA